MDSNVHIDPATFRFPEPPNNSTDKASSRPLRPKRHVGPVQLQPRSAGFIYHWEHLEARRLNKQICGELVKGPPNATLNDKSPPKHRKHSIKTVFRSRTKKRPSKEDSKMPVATQRTSDGRKYGQIISEQMYEYSGNASTYEVNKSRIPLALPANEDQRTNRTTSLDRVGDITSTTHQHKGIKEPVKERSAQSSLVEGEAEQRLSRYQTVGMRHAIPGNHGNRLLTDKLIDRNTVAGQNEESLDPLLRKSTTDDSLGLLKDLSQILSGGETTTPTAGASQTPVLGATQHQPRVRDFAANGSAPFSRARAAIRRRSRSPVKVTRKQMEAPIRPERPMDAATCGVRAGNGLGRNPNNIALPPMAMKESARPSPEPPLSMTQDQASGSKTSPVSHYHSKAPSMSAESATEDVQSDASSGVVSNAQSAVFVKVPPQPGPAPLTPLPSLPEGLDSFAPSTPRASQSSRRLPSAENSPSKVLPPARSQYKLYPSVDTSPPKRPSSPIRMNIATEPEQATTRPSPPLRSKRRGISFPRSDCLPTSMSVGTLDELEQWKRERAENTRQKKLRDLARMRSHEIANADIESAIRKKTNGEQYHQDVAELLSPADPYDSELFPIIQASHVSNLSASPKFQYRDSRMLSPKLSSLSKIMVVAEQEPILPVQHAPSQKSNLSRHNTIEEHSRVFRTNGFSPVPPHLVSPTLLGPENEGKARPVSSHSLPVPRPIASRIPTPHSSPLLRGPSNSSSHRSSMHEMSVLEARLSATERKNAMLEKAFLAVLDTSAHFGVCLGRSGTEIGRDTSVDRSSRTSGTESLYVGLENLMTFAGTRWSSSSGQ